MVAATFPVTVTEIRAFLQRNQIQPFNPPTPQTPRRASRRITDRDSLPSPD